MSDRYLRRFVDAWILLVGAFWGVQLWIAPSFHVVGGVFPLLTGLLVRGLLVLGNTRLARVTLVSLTCLLVWMAPFFVNGVRSPIFMDAIFLLVLSGWLLGRRALTVVCVLTAMVALGYATAQTEGWFDPPAPTRTAFDTGLALVEGLVLTLLALHGILNSFHASLGQEIYLQGELERNRVRMRQLLGGLHDGVLLISEDGVIEFVNQRVCDMFGVEETPAAVARTGTKVFFARVASQFADPQETLTRLRRLIAGEQSAVGVQVAMRDGRTLECNFTPLEFQGQRGGRVWHLRDISTLADTHRSLESANSQLAKLSLTDGLTGLSNRRAFDQRLQQEWGRAQRGGTGVALLLMDVDWFKRYNDHYGHQGGDHCLQSVAALLQENVRRSNELAARFGGEEFAVLVGDTSREEGMTLAQSLVDALRVLNLPHAQSTFGRVSMSVGVAFMLPTKDVSPDVLVGAADAALYGAKEAGRDRVQVA